MGNRKGGEMVEGRIVTIDNHLLSTWTDCKRKGYYRDIEEITPTGKRPGLGFGLTMHAAREEYVRGVLAGRGHDAAFASALEQLRETWKREMPDEYKDMTKVLDRRSIANAERLFGGYVSKYSMQDYKPRYVEIPFTVGLGTSPDGWEVIWSGIIDDLCEFDGGLYVVDLKTSSWPLGSNFFQGFRLSQQLKGYVFAARQLVSPDVIGGMIHGIWVHAEPIRKTSKTVLLEDYFKTDIYIWTDSQLDEWRTSVLQKVDEMQRAKETQRYPMDDGHACTAYGACVYQQLCMAPPEVRAQLIKLGYKREKWEPLKQEGEELSNE